MARPRPHGLCFRASACARNSSVPSPHSVNIGKKKMAAGHCVLRHRLRPKPVFACPGPQIGGKSVFYSNFTKIERLPRPHVLSARTMKLISTRIYFGICTSSVTSHGIAWPQHDRAVSSSPCQLEGPMDHQLKSCLLGKITRSESQLLIIAQKKIL